MPMAVNYNHEPWEMVNHQSMSTNKDLVHQTRLLATLQASQQARQLIVEGNHQKVLRSTLLASRYKKVQPFA
jgi:hypothetical protein